VTAYVASLTRVRVVVKYLADIATTASLYQTNINRVTILQQNYYKTNLSIHPYYSS